MTTYATLETQGDPTGAVRRLLARFLTGGLVDAVLAPLSAGAGCRVAPALITDPARLADVDPWLPLLPVNGARLAALLTRRTPGAAAPAGPRLAVVLRPCEGRALVELAKLNQVDLAQLLFIGIDCIGTYEAAVFASPADAAAARPAVLRAAAAARPDAPGVMPYRHACTICATPVPWSAALTLHVIGVDAASAILVETVDEALLAPLGLTAGADPSAHQAAVQAFVTARTARRQAVLADTAAHLAAPADGTPGLLEAMAGCQQCLNCTVACPICYCKSCLFRGDILAHEPDYYLAQAARRGALRLPGEGVAFQLTRLAHVSLSCVGCGLCTSACPAGLPVDALFQTVASRAQALFEYVPGRAPDEALPLLTFQPAEFETLGERVPAKDRAATGRN